jgi:hypothetical protein
VSTPSATVHKILLTIPVEHNVEKKEPEQPRRRPDLSTFFSTLELVDTSGTRQPQNIHSLPLPQDISAAFRNLANAFEMMRSRSGTAQEQSHGELLEQLVQTLMDSAEHPPTEVKGVSDEFIQELERVPKQSLKAEQTCPICSNPFLEGKNPCH